MTRIDEGRGIVDRIELDGMKISIEVEAGGTRSGTNFKGERWENKVSSAYGYILGTNSPDGEHLDVWVKKNPKEGKRVYVVHQLTPDGSRYDEDKVMLGYSSADEAIKAFKREAFKPEVMFGGYSEFDIEHFKVIAYQASNSSAMLASQRMYDKFEEKGLLPKGIKSPIQVAQIVKEGIDMLHISYGSTLIAESAFDLARRAGLQVLKANTDVLFESEEDLREFIRLIDESQEDNAHLGDIYDALPESIDEIIKLQTSKLTETRATPSVHSTKKIISSLNETHNWAIANFMVEFAINKSQTLNESLSDIDMDAALRRLANTFLMHPKAPTTQVVEAVANAAARGDTRALVEHVATTTGLSVDAFRNALAQRVWENNRITRNTFESLMEATEQGWNLNCPDKGTAFINACK